MASEQRETMHQPSATCALRHPFGLSRCAPSYQPSRSKASLAARHHSQQGISRSKASLRTNASLAATHHSQLGCEESKRWLFMWWSKRTACGCPCGRMRPWCALMLMALSSASDASQHPTRSMSRHAEGCVPSMRRVIRAATLGDHLVSDHLVNDHLMGDQLKR